MLALEIDSGLFTRPKVARRVQHALDNWLNGERDEGFYMAAALFVLGAVPNSLCGPRANVGVCKAEEATESKPKSTLPLLDF